MPGRIISDLWRTMRQFFRTEGGVEGKEISTPSNPGSGYRRLYPKSDGWYGLTSAGVEEKIGAGGASFVIDGTAGENLSQYNVVYCSTADGKYYKADNSDTLAKSQAVGIVTESGGIDEDDTGEITKLGSITNTSWNLTKGGIIYLSTAGGITQSEPTTIDDYWVPLGYASETDTVWLQIGTGIQILSPELGTEKLANDGRMELVSATSLKWDGSVLGLYDSTNSRWILCKPASVPTLANDATDLNGTALAVDKIYDVFAEYSSPTAFTLKCSRWANSGTGTSARNAAYAAGTTYSIGDRVTYSGKDYTSILGSNTGNTPSSSPTYWCDNGTSVTGDFAGLYKHDGVWVSHNSATGKLLRWLGIIYTYNNSSTVNFKDDEAGRYISNYYNQTVKLVKTTISTGSWTYSTNTWREINNGTNVVRGNFLLSKTQTVDIYLKQMANSQGSTNYIWIRPAISGVSLYQQAAIETLYSTTISMREVADVIAGRFDLTSQENVNGDSQLYGGNDYSCFVVIRA